MNYEDVGGRIFDIQRFSVHDGPGIRSIVFLKGCLFRCRWCCNPESQEFKIQTMKAEGKERTVGEDITAGEVITRIASDMPYYIRSGGGVTLSGGESLLQPEFAKAIFAECKKLGVNTAIETTGAVDYKIIEELLPYIDYFLMDIKHIDSAKHEEFCGRGNELILENAKKISAAARSYSVRVPVVPTFNDTETEIEAIAEFASKLPRVERMHLLPYHRLGQDKYEGIGRSYTLTEILPPDNGKMARLKNAAMRHFKNCVIGG